MGLEIMYFFLWQSGKYTRYVTFFKNILTVPVRVITPPPYSFFFGVVNMLSASQAKP